MNFNNSQLEAINHFKGACAVIASAGSGKTTILLNRIKNLIEVHNVPEQEILTITFTRNTGDELKQKLHKMGYDNVNVGTFHAVCRKILFQEGYDVSDQKIIKDWEIENLFKTIDNDVDVNDVISFISYQKNYNKTYNDEFLTKDSKYLDEELRIYFKKYEEYKNKKGLFDFDDLLIECLNVLKNNKEKYTYEFLLVDEHQDSNLIQNELIKEWSRYDNVFCVQDFRQSIYGFRGSNPEYAMKFSEEWENAKIINMDINYRSDKDIVHNSNNFIRKYYGNYKYYSDAIPHSEDDGNVIVDTYFDSDTEGIQVVDKIEHLLQKGVKPNEIAVLYRLNSTPSYVENELKRRNIKYDITNESSFFKRKEIAGILAYLRLVDNPHDDNAFETIFKLRNYPLAFFKNDFLKEARTFSGRNDLSLYEAFITINYPQRWQQRNIDIFKDNINRLRLQKDKGTNVVSLISNIQKVFQLEEYVREKYTNEDEIKERIDAMEILKTFVKNNTLESFMSYVYNNESNNSGFKNRKKKEDCVRLMTIHASKGLEFEHVFLIGVEDGKFPHERGDLLEEARLFYVGITRAKNNLYISDMFGSSKFVNEYLN